MKNIQRKTPNIQQSKDDELRRRVERRIKRLRKYFEPIPRGSQERFLEMLSAEIKTVEDQAVRLWLIRFQDILRMINKEVRFNA